MPVVPLSPDEYLFMMEHAYVARQFFGEYNNKYVCRIPGGCSTALTINPRSTGSIARHLKNLHPDTFETLRANAFARRVRAVAEGNVERRVENLSGVKKKV